MEGIAVVGLDLAKTLFQVHGVAANGSFVVRKQLRRGQVLPFFAGLSPCLIGIGAAGRGLLLLARSQRRASAETSVWLCRPVPGRRLWRLWQAL
jgi:transposase